MPRQGSIQPHLCNLVNADGVLFLVTQVLNDHHQEFLSEFKIIKQGLETVICLVNRLQILPCLVYSPVDVAYIASRASGRIALRHEYEDSDVLCSVRLGIPRQKKSTISIYRGKGVCISLETGMGQLYRRLEAQGVTLGSGGRRRLGRNAEC